MSTLLYFVIGFFVLLVIVIAAYLLTARKYQSSATVANSYDQWTLDGIVEFYWGEHIHLGHYGLPPRRKDFLADLNAVTLCDICGLNYLLHIAKLINKQHTLN